MAKTLTKEKDLMGWLSQILIDAGIYDYRYPIKGCGIWLPYGFKIRENMLKIIRKHLDEKGHQEVLFPLLIPEYNLKKEAEHIAGFMSEVYWVTKGGDEELKVKHALRPTSETAIYPMYALWVRSHKDLPIKYYQVVNIFRYETKTTRPIIRVREVLTFKEAHTVHATKEEAEKQFKEAVEIYSKIFDELALPHLVLRRPDWDKFAGAVYTVAHDTIMPNGRRLQIGTVHYLGQNFSKAFDIKYLKPNGAHEYVYQLCYGISGRPVAAIVAIHSDERGLILPPNVAPIKAVIIPIYYKKEKEIVIKYCEKIKRTLEKNGITVETDYREEETPGSKFYYWEMKGVPIRIEIGIKEVKEKKATVQRRDTLTRVEVSWEELVSYIKKTLHNIQGNLKKRADEWMKSMIKETDSLEIARKEINNGYVIKTPWCGREECGKTIEEITDARVYGYKYGQEEAKGKCPICNQEASKIIYIGKTY